MDSAYMIFSAFIIGHAVSRLVFGHLTIAGSWVGVWTKSGDPLAVEVVFKEHGGLTGYFGSDGLQVAGIPFSEVTFNPPSVHFVLKGDATTAIFDGKIHDGEVNGTFTEGASKGKFLLKRAPRQESLVKSRDVVFRNRNVSLAGSLIQPVTKGSHPAIVFLHGSGPEGRWANRYLAESFAKAGFAALVYDKRGVGQSTGDWRKADFEDLASDALAGIRFLRAQVGVDPKHIGIYGHSQGGTLAPLVAEHDRRLAFLIGSAAGGIDLAKMEAYSVENSIGVRSLHPPEAEDAHRFVEEIVDVAYHRKGRETLDQMATTFKGRTWYFDPPPSRGGCFRERNPYNREERGRSVT